MIYPSIEELTRMQNYNRYVLVIATAKCAHLITNEYVNQREVAERALANKETDTLTSMIKREYRDEKAVKCAIKHLYQGDFRIIESSVEEAARSAHTPTWKDDSHREDGAAQ